MNNPRYVFTLSLIFRKAMSCCSVDGQVSWPFPCRIIRDGDVFATATNCTDSIVAKMRRRAAMIVEAAVHVRLVYKSQQFCDMEARQTILCKKLMKVNITTW